MARGDVVSGIAGVASGSRLVFQPPAGVEIMITEIGAEVWSGTASNRTPGTDVILTNGTRVARVRSSHNATHWGGGTLKLFITNSLYLALSNGTGTFSDLAYTGVQTK